MDKNTSETKNFTEADAKIEAKCEETGLLGHVNQKVERIQVTFSEKGRKTF